MLLEPLHRTQPVGILATEPDHKTIVPEGTRLAAAIAACTNAVVAICVLLVVAVDWVGASGVPVKVGLFVSALEEIAEAIALYSVSISVPLIILPALPLGSESLAAKFVAFV